jgi:transcriptional regulator with XRE-family HTH domain
VRSDPFIDATGSYVADFVKEAREKRDLSLQVLSKISGVSRQNIRNIEQNLQSPSIQMLMRIARPLHVDAAKLLARAQKMASKTTAPPKA